ncbi:MAG: dihydroorotate dehydrogenase (quinone) [Candidatus Woykebacteria bacterium RBG_13_40_15]|uniref:Dihydroorotate dehydrogenase (quinone) n=1 Tax=Candidatus Woykebacteria bacterium RBG_13_40_15 TaxID=1802593 RepID=A0A1G1W715_9BACT|nr:MAG: dihydroorotate dehydrogenase (quinone) [Candidatus Woykebacteria bacterium RBG_13_40_15]
MEIIISVRNTLLGFLYRAILRPVLFLIEAETVHNLAINTGRFLGSNPVTRFKTGVLFNYSNKTLSQELAGIRFKNPIGLAAGFDKDGYLTNILPSVGFGFAEIGSVTGEPCSGNPKPRLWRIPKSKGIVVNYGLRNEGCKKISKRLGNKNFSIPVGVNVAKTNSAKTSVLKDGIADYVKAYKSFLEIGAFFTINISCPNAFGGEPFTDPGKLELLLAEIDKTETKKPIFLKMPPDLPTSQVDEIINVAERHKITGFVCSNLTKKRIKLADKSVPVAGGISGKPAEAASNELISYIYRKFGKKFVIIGCGGVFSAEDAYKKIKLGASLIELITGMIYDGPQVVAEINQGLARLLKKDGLESLSEAVGLDNRPE